MAAQSTEMVGAPTPTPLQLPYSPASARETMIRKPKAVAFPLPLTLLLATVLVGTVLLGRVPCQQGAKPDKPAAGGDPALHGFTTPAGDRVLIVRTPAQPLVHWAIWTPAGAGEDPLYWPGLSVAVARAGLSGTGQIGAVDRDREIAAMQAVDQWIQAERAGADVELELLKEAMAEARKVSDWFAWPRVMAAIPTSMPVVTVSPGLAHPGPKGSATSSAGGAPTGTVLQLSCPPDAVGEVAERLAERRRDPALRAIWSLYSLEQPATRASRQAEPFRPLRAELLHLAFPGEPRSLAFDPVPDRKPLPTLREAALVWQLTQHPRRTVHVLVGDLDPEATQALLSSAFASPSGMPLPPTPASVSGSKERVARIQSQNYPAVALGFRLSGDEDPALLEVACRWLAEGWTDPLAKALGGPGRQLVVTQAVPNLGATATQPGLLVLEVMVIPARNGAITATQLLAETQAALTSMLASPKATDAFQAGIASWRRELAARLADPAGLAAELAEAVAWGRDPAGVDRRGEEITWTRMQRELGALVQNGSRVVVTAEVDR